MVMVIYERSCPANFLMLPLHPDTCVVVIYMMAYTRTRTRTRTCTCTYMHTRCTRTRTRTRKCTNLRHNVIYHENFLHDVCTDKYVPNVNDDEAFFGKVKDCLGYADVVLISFGSHAPG